MRPCQHNLNTFVKQYYHIFDDFESATGEANLIVGCNFACNVAYIMSCTMLQLHIFFLPFVDENVFTLSEMFARTHYLPALGGLECTEHKSRKTIAVKYFVRA